LDTKDLRIFMSWSGSLSKEIATLFEENMEFIFDSNVSSSMSKSSIEPGEIWSQRFGKELEMCEVGIIFLSHENHETPWLLFEAGVLANQFEATCVMVLCLDLEEAQITKSPFSQFQCVKFTLLGIKDIVKTIANLCNQSERVEVFHERLEAAWDKNLKLGFEGAASKSGTAKDKVSPQIINNSGYDLIVEMTSSTQNLLKGLLPRALSDISSQLSELNAFISKIGYKDLEFIAATTAYKRIANKLFEFHNEVRKLLSELPEKCNDEIRQALQNLENRLSILLGDLR
jgi:hypothetical protein